MILMPVMSMLATAEHFELLRHTASAQLRPADGHHPGWFATGVGIYDLDALHGVDARGLFDTRHKAADQG